MLNSGVWSSYLGAWHACEGASGVGLHNGGEEGNGDGDVGREINAFRGAGACGDLGRGEDENDAAAKIFYHT
jgi:hypothetical protein